jgi:hypothetical protein
VGRAERASACRMRANTNTKNAGPEDDFNEEKEQ